VERVQRASREPARDLIELCVYCAKLGALRLAWHVHDGDLHRGTLTRQRQELVHRYAGSDGRITQARFANLLWHAFSAYGCHICEDGD
jgi:hypothetical protein